MPTMDQIKEADLLTGVLGVLYQKLTMGDDSNIRKNNQFFAWLPSGMALSPKTLQFMKGLMGESPMSPSEMAAAQAVANATKQKAEAELAIENGADPAEYEAVISEADKVYEREKDAHERLQAAAKRFCALAKQLVTKFRMRKKLRLFVSGACLPKSMKKKISSQTKSLRRTELLNWFRIMTRGSLVGKRRR